MSDNVKVLVVGVGNMGTSHALAYQNIDGFELAGLMSRNLKNGAKVADAIADVPRFEDFDEAMRTVQPDAVSINTYPDTHVEFAMKAMDAGCHVFMEKPIATAPDLGELEHLA